MSSVVWAWGLEGETCDGFGVTKSCHLIFQNDGNLVFYYPNGKVIDTVTYNQNASYIILTTRYFK